MDSTINILTGKIQSGKTTKLFKFVNENQKVDGILAPIVNGKRRLYHISTKTIKDLEVSCPNNFTVSVGKYHFLQESFSWANDRLLQSSKSSEILIIDEIGKLELKGEGLHLAIQEILNNLNQMNIKLILVVRDYLIDEVLEYYEIKKYDYEIMMEV